jgi:hypothetical protein
MNAVSASGCRSVSVQSIDSVASIGTKTMEATGVNTMPRMNRSIR